METAYAIPVIPDWLIDEQSVMKRTSKEIRELTNKQYEIAFESVLVQMADGTELAALLRDYHTPIDYSRFLAWIFADKQRKQRYYDMQAIGAEAVSGQIIDIADATNDSMEDVQRSKLRIDARFRLLAVRDRKRFGDVKQLDVNMNQTVDIKGLLEQREKQLMNGITIDGNATLIEGDEE